MSRQFNELSFDRGALAVRVHSLHSQGWQLTAEDLLSMARPLAQALEAIHTAKLVHRDLSPGNLMLATEPAADATPSTTRLVTQHERLLLSDLGMCKDLAITSGLTVSGGTAGFRPPEQSKPGLVETRADIWAASALLAWVSEGADLSGAFHDVMRRAWPLILLSVIKPFRIGCPNLKLYWSHRLPHRRPSSRQDREQNSQTSTNVFRQLLVGH